MMRHYLDMKEKYKGCILFYRLGDFYEMFFEDAEKVSKLLDLTLTGKDCGLEERAPMCGIPYHAADVYISKLVALGEKVAICEQLSDPKESKGLVERDVVRVVSAGTLIDDAMLDETKNNYIACLFKAGESIAAAWTDITTGEFSVAEFSGVSALEDTITQIVKLSVAEVICNEEMLLASKDVKEIRHNLLPAFSCYVPWAFNVKHAEKNLLEQFQTLSLAAYGIAGKENAIAAAGALVEKLKHRVLPAGILGCRDIPVRLVEHDIRESLISDRNSGQRYRVLFRVDVDVGALHRHAVHGYSTRFRRL